jgi:hypothetical protein
MSLERPAITSPADVDERTSDALSSQVMSRTITKVRMPYLTKRAHDNLEWMSLKDAVRYVANVEGEPSEENFPNPYWRR